ncbi:MAG TPA: radical SAM family heme chaperone HemW [Candidatus Binatia bacterium]|nr:radical SAM family heme chaperone HemW [Candidatus Binatia bacterium]
MPAGQEPFSLYVHIPYCISKCPYCDFNSHVVPEIPEANYTEALIQELNQYARVNHWRDRSVQTIFFGGGTPSTFQPSSIARILERANVLFPIDSACEITLETNPGTVESANFAGYRSYGVNRISVGVQSFQPHLLNFLGRVHSADEAVKALQVIGDAGFENFSLDLIYANPGQTLRDLENDLETALGFQSPHLSAYNLTIEEGTPFHHEYRSGRIRLLSEDQEIAMAELIEQRLSDAGLQRYEISNYARPGFHSRHNLNYWQSGDYLGIGAGAHSHKRVANHGIYGQRWWNEKHPARYMSKISESGQAVIDAEESDLSRAAGEYMFSGLRLMEGISLKAFSVRFGKNILALYPQISGWVSEGFMETEGEWLRLTHRGILVANSIFVHFV